MTENEAIEYLKQTQEISDTESAHYNADEILCRLLISLGYQKVVKEYNKIKKWYG